MKSGSIARLALLTILFASQQAVAGAYEDFIRAVMQNQPRTVRQLLAKGVDVNTVDSKGNSALALAVREGNKEVIEVLLEGRARVDSKNQFGETPLMLASIKGDRMLSAQLLEAGASPSQPGWNPLIYAAVDGHNELIRLLLERGADVNGASPNGTTALMMAARGGHQEAMLTLLEYGAKIDQANDAGGTALGWAMDAGHQEIGELLIKAGATR